jgi:two-component system cell cycle sensor histidine kinase/response regulator CckA
VPVAAAKKRPSSRPSERLLAAALATLGEGVVIASADWQRGGFPVVFANASLCTLTGWSAAELRGQPHGRLHADQRSLAALRRWRTAANPADTLTGEGYLNRREGGPLYATWTYSLVTDPRGPVTHVAVTYRDLTAKRRLQEDLIHSQRLEAVNRLAGGVAHDFNNLLSVINGYCEILAAKPALREAARELGEIHRAGIEAAGLVRQLLAFSRRQSMTPLVVSLNQLVADNAGILAKLLGADKSLILDLAATTDHVRVEPAQLQQVLLNLTLNARDAMAAGGRVTLRSANHTVSPTGHTRRDDPAPGRYLKLSVQDDGRGMDEATQAQLFEPFFTTKPHGQGTGLGLALVYGVVQQSGGFISVRSAPGQGSCFEILLPEVTEALSQQPASLGPLPSTRGKETLLLVEADLVVAKMVSGILTADGYTVLTVPRASAALPLVLRHGKPVHLLIGDLNPAEGAKLVRTLQARHPELRLIATDAKSTPTRTGVVAHGHRTLPKPYAMSTLLQTVRAVLDETSPQTETAPAPTTTGRKAPHKAPRRPLPRT